MDVTAKTSSKISNQVQGTSDSVTQRTNIYIIFAEFSCEETSHIISYLHGHQFAPRGKNITGFEEITQALTERSWDLILCKHQQHAFDPLTIAKQLEKIGKDIPILQLLEEPTQEDATKALLNGIQATLPIDDDKLLLLHISREYHHLASRRALRLIQLQLLESQKRCKILMDNSALAICFINQQKIVYLNNAFCHLFGYKIPDQLFSKPITNLIASQEQEGLSKLLSSFIDSSQSHLSYQLLAKRADNTNFTAHIDLQQTLFNEQACIEMTVEGNKIFKNEQKFAELDAITGLYNLGYFTDILQSNLKQALQGGSDTQLVYIDISNFLNIRAQHGNEASRTVARDVADSLNQTFSKAHIKARLSDHIFAVIYADPDVKKINKIASKLNTQLNNHHCHFENETIEIQSAIAIVPVTDIATSAQHLYDCAEKALEKCQRIIVKENRVVIYNPLLDPSKNDNLQSIEQTQTAIADNRLRLLFQPIIPLVFNCEEQYYETFLRMIGNEGQDILPANFLSSVKHADLSESMDKWVIENSIRQFKSSEDTQLKLKLFISVTDTVWERESLLMWLSDILRTSRIQADSIIIQISEMEAANSLSKAKYFIDGLRKLNCLICLKHYGSTSESKTILKALNPDYIKFDGNLIQQLTDDTFIDSIFESLLTDVKNHGKITIATQVESPKVMSALWKHGIGMVQGFYLQAPAKEMKYEF